MEQQQERQQQQQHGRLSSQETLAACAAASAATPQLPPRRPLPPPQQSPAWLGDADAGGLRSRAVSSSRVDSAENSDLRTSSAIPPALPARPTSAVAGPQHVRASSTSRDAGDTAPAASTNTGARLPLSVGTAGLPPTVPAIYETPPSATNRETSSVSSSPSPGPSRSPSPQRHHPPLTSLDTSTSSFRDELSYRDDATTRPSLQLFGLASPVRQDIQAALEELRNLELVNG